jgi:SAM-dependent methyltransferase
VKPRSDEKRGQEPFSGWPVDKPASQNKVPDTFFRLRSERTFHDRQACERRVTFSRCPNELCFDDDSYLDHETWIRPAFALLGEVHGLHVLDYGCGHGMAAVVLARRGARVTALDLSSGYLAEASCRAAANGVLLDYVQADGERLPFADGSFDRIWGNAILHHLDVTRAGRELRRVLRPGGVAVCCEPWGENPILNLARRWLPGTGRERTPDEHPLRQRQVRVLERFFPQVEMHGYQLLSMACRLLQRRRLVAVIDRCDNVLLRRLPRLQHFCRYIVLTLRNS